VKIAFDMELTMNHFAAATSASGMTDRGTEILMANHPIIDLQVSSEDIVAFLKQELQYKQIVQRILYQRVIQATSAQRLIHILPEEIQAIGDQFRMAHALEKISDTLNWLQLQDMTVEDWERGIHHRLLAQQLAANLFASEAEKRFAEQRLDYDRVVLYHLEVPYESLVYELFYQIDEDEMSFYEAAHLYDINAARRHRCGFEGIVGRWEIPPQFATQIFGATVQQVTEPIRDEDGYHLFWVEEVIAGQLTEENRQNIIQTAFQTWLESELTYHQHQ
jgi:parvulin-like peptidyl-prolyl isomerase